jgi:hypothetical protein
VEGVVQRQDRGAVRPVFVEAVFAREFDDAFVRLRTGVGEEDAGHAGAAAERLGQTRGGLGIKEVRHVPELHALVEDRLRPLRVGVADGAHADAACKIDVPFPVDAEENGAFAAFDADGEACIGVQDVRVVHSPQFFKGHARSAPNSCNLR